MASKRLRRIMSHLNGGDCNENPLKSISVNNGLFEIRDRDHAYMVAKGYMDALDKMCKGEITVPQVAEKWIAEDYFAYEQNSHTRTKKQWIEYVQSVVDVIESFRGDINVIQFSKRSILYTFVELFKFTNGRTVLKHGTVSNVFDENGKILHRIAYSGGGSFERMAEDSTDAMDK